MNTRPDPDLPDGDSRFDAAWRSASNEAPPPALDAAILAAAHREAGAGPQRVDGQVREATRPEKWWFPLAAAATIGAIAIGLLQIAGPDKIGGSDAITTVVSDMPPGTTSAPRETVATPSPAPAASTADAPLATGTIAPPPSAPERAPAVEAPRQPRAQTVERARPEPKFAPPEPAALMGTTKLAAPAADRATIDTARDRREARTPLPVAEWIALIRKLRDEGRDDEAAKELTAFRNLHPDHEQLLPPDLSRWQPGGK